MLQLFDAQSVNVIVPSVISLLEIADPSSETLADSLASAIEPLEMFDPFSPVRDDPSDDHAGSVPFERRNVPELPIAKRAQFGVESPTMIEPRTAALATVSV